MSVDATIGSTITAVETLDLTAAPAAVAQNRKVTHNQFNSSFALTASTTPPVTKTAQFQQALTAGSAQIDLTAAPGTNGATVDFTGLKVQGVKFRNPAANANTITVDVPGTNGYNLAGAAFSVTLSPGQEAFLYGNDATPDVGASARLLDLTGTGTQALDVAVIAG